MRVNSQCSKCVMENGVAGFQNLSFQINDERFFELTCPIGHKTATIIQHPKHEILFEIGMNALVDGYSREAVTSFASCLENFYKFCIERMSIHHGFKWRLHEKELRILTKQSERITGAFIMLWIAAFQAIPKTLPEDCASFRNKVVHQGYIPNNNEALEFGSQVASCIASNLKKMYQQLGDTINSVIMSEFFERAHSKKQPMSTLIIPRTIGWEDLLDGKEIDLPKRMLEISEDRAFYNSLNAAPSTPKI